MLSTDVLVLHTLSMVHPDVLPDISTFINSLLFSWWWWLFYHDHCDHQYYYNIYFTQLTTSVLKYHHDTQKVKTKRTRQLQASVYCWFIIFAGWTLTAVLVSSPRSTITSKTRTTITLKVCIIRPTLSWRLQCLKGNSITQTCFVQLLEISK